MNDLHTPDDRFASNLEICYEVLLYLSSRLAKLRPGEVLEFVTSDPEADEKIPSWCEMRGFELLESKALPEGRRSFRIRR